MGYSFGQNERGNWVLSCDSCGDVGGVRKRACRFKVLGSSRGSNGVRYALPWCPAPALCSACFKKHGGSKGIHTEERCGEGARWAQAEADAEEAVLASGASIRVAAWGDWAESVPEGMVRVLFRTGSGVESNFLMSNEAYHAIGMGTTATPDSYRALGFDLVPFEGANA